ncbi:MAG TPA: GNAT family N-acetyltransferase [Burkholderiales bacterium]|nr:GNAT family N-acetyltransferase [Burkholderiales bacterium]
MQPASQLAHRLAKAEDLPQIVEIYNSTISSRIVTADTEPVSVAARQAWFEQHKPGSRPLWVVEQDGRCVGWLSFSSFYGRPAYNSTAELSVYVHGSWRARGVGSYLLREAIDHAPRIGVATLLGFVFAHNTPSLRLFEKFGFSRWGLLPRVAVLDGVERDLVILGRRADERGTLR